MTSHTTMERPIIFGADLQNPQVYFPKFSESLPIQLPNSQNLSPYSSFHQITYSCGQIADNVYVKTCGRFDEVRPSSQEDSSECVFWSARKACASHQTFNMSSHIHCQLFD